MSDVGLTGIIHLTIAKKDHLIKWWFFLFFYETCFECFMQQAAATVIFMKK